MGDPLDVDLEEVPGQELETDPSVMRKMEQVDCVNGLLHGHQDVDNPEVVLETVANEDTAAVDQEPELLIGWLEGGQMLGAEVGIQVT